MSTQQAKGMKNSKDTRYRNYQIDISLNTLITFHIRNNVYILKESYIKGRGRRSRVH